MQSTADQQISEIESNVMEFDRIFAVSQETSQDRLTLKVELNEDFKRLVDVVLKESPLRDERKHRINFHLPFQKNFERLFHSFIETYCKRELRDLEGVPKQRIKWNQINSFLNGEKSLGGISSQSFQQIFMEFMLNCKITSWHFHEYGVKFLTKIRIQSFQKVFLMIQEINGNGYRFKHIQISEAWPLAKVQCFF